MACSITLCYSNHIIKENHNRDTLMCILDQGRSKHKDWKITCSQNCSNGKSIIHTAYKGKRYCRPTQSCFVPFLLKECYFRKHSVEEDIKVDSEYGKTMSDASSSEDENLDDSGNVEKDTLNSLEWQSLCNQVAEFTSTGMGYTLAKEGHLPIGSNLHDSEELLDQTTAALLLHDALDFSGIQDIRNIIDCAVSGEICKVNELCAVKRTLQSASSIFEKLHNHASEMKFNVDGNFSKYTKGLDPLLKIFEGADFCTDLENELDHCLDCMFLSVPDRASHALSSIRSNKRSNMEFIEALLKETAGRIAEAGGMDSPLVTRRRTRMCVGIRAAKKSLLPGGIVLDVSSSGATYFMEPREVLDLNNMEVQLAAAERSEELAIFGRLVSRIAGESVKIMNVLERIMVTDLACARAGHACWLGAVRPIFTQEVGNTVMNCVEMEKKIEINDCNRWFVDIEGIQHPILLEPALQKSTIYNPEACSKNAENINNSSDTMVKLPVPVDIKIGPQKKVVIISGPNAGGKTATMKTLGLAAIMAKAGMFLAAKDQPKLPWFDCVMADIGDNQSLEQSLSTYSGHIQRLRKIMEISTRKSLVLVDEIGSGTDPSEGVALSASILQHFVCHVNLTVVTTHYEDLTRLKEKDDRFENAAMEFDIRTLLPTYRVLWGTTGQSNALDIAQTLGFNSEILSRAREWVKKLLPDRQKERQSGVYQSLSKQRDELQDQARIAAVLLSEARELHNEICKIQSMVSSWCGCGQVRLVGDFDGREPHRHGI